jgi:hypothetical protein
MRVPLLPTTPPAAQLQHTVTFVPLKSPPLGQMTTTGLNPSSSTRFTLSIPLLGRAKVPLGSVLGKKNDKGMFGSYNGSIHAFVQCSGADLVFLLKDLDSVSGIMESVAVMNSRIEVKCLPNSFFSPLHQPVDGNITLSRSFRSLSHPSFDFEIERQRPCQRGPSSILFPSSFLLIRVLLTISFSAMQNEPKKVVE